MSRILFPTTVCGKSIPIIVGWDRRLAQCYLSISALSLDDKDYEDERFDRILEASAMGLCRNLSATSIRGILEKAEVAVPAGVLDLLEEHEQRNVGNVIVQFEADGACKVLHDDDQANLATCHERPNLT